MIGGKSAVADQTGSCIIKIKINTVGNLALEKTSSNENITGIDANGYDSNGCYSREGAVYGVYNTKEDAENAVAGSDESKWGSKLFTMTTDKAGKAKAEDLSINQNMDISWYYNNDPKTKNNTKRTFYIKELKASKGYCLDEEIYSVDVKIGETTTLQVKEVPQNDPVNVLCQKYDAETGEASPLGGAKLEGAKFTVYYYDTTDASKLPKDYATRIGKALKKWVYKTDSKGVVSIQGSNPLEGSSEVFKDSNGDTTLAIGTYVIEETKAPAGYLLPAFNERTFIEVVTPEENSNSEKVKTYHHETYTPQGRMYTNNKTGKTYTYEGLNWMEWKLPGEE